MLSSPASSEIRDHIVHACWCQLFLKLGSHKYITEAYLQKYDILNDRVFQYVISNELSHTICIEQNRMPRLSVLQRKLIGEGSHRRLTSSIKVENQPEVSLFTDVSAFGDTYLELHTVRSNRSVVEIHMDLGPSTLSKLAPVSAPGMKRSQEEVDPSLGES